MILKQRGIISVYIKNYIASESSPYILLKLKYTLTKAPITPKLVTLRFSKGLPLLEVFKKGYKYNGMWANYNNEFSNTIQKLRFSFLM